MPGTKTTEELFQEFENIVTSKEATEQRAARFFNENVWEIVEVIHNNETLLDVAIRKKCHSLIIEQLLSYRVDIHAKDSLHIAVKNNNIKVVNALLENSQSIKLNINEKDEKGSTALDCAKSGSEMYVLLESHGAAHSAKNQHLKALGIKVDDFDEEKLKTDGAYCFGILEKVLNRASKKDFEDVIEYFVESGYFNILESRQGVSMEEMAIDWYEESPSQINDRALQNALQEYINEHLGSQEEYTSPEDLLKRLEEYTPSLGDLLKGLLTTQYSFQMLKNALKIKNTALREKMMGYLIAQGVDIDCEGKDYRFEDKKKLYYK